MFNILYTKFRFSPDCLVGNYFQNHNMTYSQRNRCTVKSRTRLIDQDFRMILSRKKYGCHLCDLTGVCSQQLISLSVSVSARLDKLLLAPQVGRRQPLHLLLSTRTPPLGPPATPCLAPSTLRWRRQGASLLATWPSCLSGWFDNLSIDLVIRRLSSGTMLDYTIFLSSKGWIIVLDFIS